VPPAALDASDASRRERIVAAASALLTEGGYSSISTLAIASRARVSKRELYRLFGDKQDIIEACIAQRAGKMRLAISDSPPADRQALLTSLETVGSATLRELSDPTVLALYRVAVSMADETPEIAAMLDRSGRDVLREAIRGLIGQAQVAGLMGRGDPLAITGEFFGLLWGDLQMRLILGVAELPTVRERDRRARAAASALVSLHPPG
jgi:AcrR family transcriptional regulator